MYGTLYVLNQLSTEPTKYARYHIFFFNDTATTEIYTLSLHDALPISRRVSPVAGSGGSSTPAAQARADRGRRNGTTYLGVRTEEHTSELQSQANLGCRLLL